MNKLKIKQGGARQNCGRKKSGREQITLHLLPQTIRQIQEARTTPAGLIVDQWAEMAAEYFAAWAKGKIAGRRMIAQINEQVELAGRAELEGQSLPRVTANPPLRTTDMCEHGNSRATCHQCYLEDPTQ